MYDGDIFLSMMLMIKSRFGLMRVLFVKTTSRSSNVVVFGVNICCMLFFFIVCMLFLIVL